jgi:hypothetical protein
MIFKPCDPKAGPTGGAGLAAPAGKFNLIVVLIFLAIVDSLNSKLVIQNSKQIKNSKSKLFNNSNFELVSNFEI